MIQPLAERRLTRKSWIATVRRLIPRIGDRRARRRVGIVGVIGLLAEVVRVGSGLTGEVRCGGIGVEWIWHTRRRREMTGERALIERGKEGIVIGGGMIGRGRRAGRWRGSRRRRRRIVGHAGA